jgi:hypothetical protein
MKIISEEVEGSLYSEFILASPEIEKLLSGKILEGVIEVRKRPCYISIRKEGYEDTFNDDDEDDI